MVGTQEFHRNHIEISQESIQFHRKNAGIGKNSCIPSSPSVSLFVTYRLMHAGSGGRTAIPVTSLKVGDEVLVRKQGGARHTVIEIQEFIVEK